MKECAINMHRMCGVLHGISILGRERRDANPISAKSKKWTAPEMLFLVAAGLLGVVRCRD